MSSAALQASTHQPATLAALNSHPSAPQSSHRQYNPAEAPSREGYYVRDDPAAASPTTTQYPSQRPGDLYPADPANASPMTSRSALASPVPVAAADYQQNPSTSARRRHDPPVAPPRTSSTHQGGSRRATRAEERASGSPRRATAEGSSRMAPNGYEDAATRRATYQEPMGREGRQSAASITMPIRSSTASSSKQPSREASEVLNRLIVSQPEVDVDRERLRLDESHADALAQQEYEETVPPPVADRSASHDDGRRGARSRHDFSKKEKGSRFGEYYLGNTIGEGEFGKVKLGWKQDGGVQVAIKLIRRDSVGSNPSRLAKIYREVAILRGVSHPNIVRLHEMSETERHIGIVLEYASGGELFDYILNHRYLKDHAARRLFAQLISGVGYLHKKGIVHRDLKLENLLLDRNRNIIITDFGFANTFDPADELSEEEEVSLQDREFVKRIGLDQVKHNGMRKGDLMQTSCGSPCYAAPELVVSDSLYTGRKVDVWSCGVILYAMLAGYLPFDDDPANPEGDNINLLYKYIVNTPLTFPEYVTPHARDLLRRILVPNPRKRADLFEVARHSWLSEYAHVVGLITSTTTTSNEIQNTTVPSEDAPGGLGRSASVREPAKAKPTSTALGDLTRKPGQVDAEEAAKAAKEKRDTKRRTVQVEYVAPTTQTQRGETSAQSSPRGKTRARSSSQGPTEVQAAPNEKPLPRDPPISKQSYAGSAAQRRESSRKEKLPPSVHQTQRLHVDVGRVSEGQLMAATPTTSSARPQTRGSMQSSGSRRGAGPSRASYGQPTPPTVAGTNVHGRMSQPNSGARISSPSPQDIGDDQPSRSNTTASKRFSQVPAANGEQQAAADKGHRRSSTLGEITGKVFGRSGSIFGGRKKREEPPAEKPAKKYPPISYANAVPSSTGRQSMDSRVSRRSFSQSLGLSRKPSGSLAGSLTSQDRPGVNRRFSLMKAMGLSNRDATRSPSVTSQQDLPIQDTPLVDSTGLFLDPSQLPVSDYDGASDERPRRQRMSLQPAPTSAPTHVASHVRYNSDSRPSGVPPYLQQGAVLSSGSELSVDRMQRQSPASATHQGGSDSEGQDSQRQGGPSRGVLHKNNRKFNEAYNAEEFGRSHDHAGSSGAAKRVMDFFRRRGKARGGEA